MPVHPLAGRPAPPELRIDVAALEREYHERLPDLSDPRQRVAFGTSGHRGTPGDGSFTEAHILATSQALCEYRASHGVDGPLFLGKDTHALSAPAERSALEVFAANGVATVLQSGGGFTPTPAISRAILAWNRGRTRGLADGVIVTPSHNPPADGGFKYNPPHGGPADTDVTGWIQERANELLRGGNSGVRRIPWERARSAPSTSEQDLRAAYVEDLRHVVDMECIRAAGPRLGVDPLGGAAIDYWEPIGEAYGLDLEVVNPRIDPTFGFMSVDHDGKIRMDCSSAHAMAGLIRLKDRFHVAFGNDADCDRHGIVTPSGGLMNPNHFLAVAIRYLLAHRPGWPAGASVGKTLVSSAVIDRVVARLGRRLLEVPVGFKWFVPGLSDGSCCFGGEESAGASFLRRDGSVWTTDKDGLIMDLLAAEIRARSGRDPAEHYREISAEVGASWYTRIDAPAGPEQKRRLKRLAPEMVAAERLAGDRIVAKLSRAPGNGAELGGLKVVAEGGWFAARPSGTEDLYKLYAESFRGEAHLAALVAEAQRIVAAAIAAV